MFCSQMTEKASNIIMARDCKNEFCKKVSHSLNKHNLLWLNEDLWRLMKQRDSALKTALKSGIPHKRKFQGLRNKVVKELRQAKANYFIKLINESKGNSKSLIHSLWIQSSVWPITQSKIPEHTN